MKQIAIIGAGVAGLSAGIFAQLNGFPSHIYESHFLPGGMCTAWRRKSYLFEGCLHFIGLFGTKPEHQFYRLWETLGVLPELRVHHYDISHEFSDTQGRRLRWFTDARKLEAEMLSLSPQDAPEIRSLCRAARLAAGFMRRASNPWVAAANLWGMLRMIPILKRHGGLSLGDYAKRFGDPLIQKAVASFFVHPELPANSLLMFMGTYHMGAAGYPLGSSLAMAKAMEARYLALGGQVSYRRRVGRILEDGGRVRGIELADGQTVEADIVVSAADLHATCTELLGDRHTPERLRERFARQPLFHPLVQVSLGVAMDLSGLPHSRQCALPQAIQVAGIERKSIWFQHFAFDPHAAPQGKSVIIVLYPSSLSWWESFDRAGPAYAAEKARILELTVQALDREIPGLAQRLEMGDVATPLTTVRYTGNWRGALGFMPDAGLVGEFMLDPRYTLEGLEGFYQAGQWVKGMGVPMAAMAGKDIARLICRAEGKRFVGR